MVRQSIWFSALPDLSFYVKTVLCVCCATMLLRWHTVIEYYKYPKLGMIKQSKFYGKIIVFQEVFFRTVQPTLN